MRAHTLAALPPPRLLLTLNRLRVPFSGDVDVHGSPKLELVDQTVSLPAIAVQAGAEHVAADAALTKPADRSVDSNTAIEGRGDRRVRADPYRASIALFQDVQRPGVAPPGAPLGATRSLGAPASTCQLRPPRGRLDPK